MPTHSTTVKNNFTATYNKHSQVQQVSNDKEPVITFHSLATEEKLYFGPVECI